MLGYDLGEVLSHPTQHEYFTRFQSIKNCEDGRNINNDLENYP